MLIADAQPTGREAHDARSRRSRHSAASGALIAIALTLLTLTAPACARAQGPATAEAGTGAWPWPLLGEVITPYRNGSDPYAAGQHRGLDIAAPDGSPVLAIVDGRVSYSGRLPDGGQTITLRSVDGEWLISNLHLSRRDVTRGETVRTGEKIGAVGTTGRRSAAQPHLHLSVRRASTRAYVDPMGLLGARRLPPRPIAAQATPKITVLERPSARSAEVHAQAGGDSSPAQRHGVRERQVTAARPAGAHAREGHAANRGISRVAPPPLKSERVAVSASAPAHPAVTSPHPREAASAPATPKKLLIAIAIVCAAALLMRRRRTGIGPPEIPAENAAEVAEVIPLRQAS
ncbi:MAG: M23 family metallopeptidase [Solirubrobacterales bacterium]